MAVALADAQLPGLFQHRDQVADIGMHIAVRQQAQKMQRLAVFQAIVRQVFPGLGLEQAAVFDGFAHELCALGIDLAAAQRIVPDLGVAHIVIRRQADGGTVGLEPGIGASGKQLIQRRGLGLGDCVACAAVTFADAIHNY